MTAQDPVTPKKPRQRKAAMPKVRETDIQRAIFESLRWRRDLVIWRTNTRVIDMPGQGGRRRPVQFGVTGGGDITGIVKPWGLHLEIEVKRPGNKQSPQQLKREQDLRAAGALYVLAHDAMEATLILDREIRDWMKRVSITLATKP